jgi:hypothetical protein
MDRKARRFNLGDLMILVAAIGLATMSLRNLWHGHSADPAERYWSVTLSRLLIAAALSACVTPLTLACLAYRIRGPRPPWRRVARHPGTAALLVCSVIFAFQTRANVRVSQVFAAQVFAI